ncbi:MAG TPA: hypothetical protein VGW38_23110 [Chloroflexota bacterium]|nr:hypothetical protein [Chloroflexota bacterium]
MPSTVFLVAAYVIAGACLALYAIHLQRRRARVVHQLAALNRVGRVEPGTDMSGSGER